MMRYTGQDSSSPQAYLLRTCAFSGDAVSSLHTLLRFVSFASLAVFATAVFAEVTSASPSGKAGRQTTDGNT